MKSQVIVPGAVKSGRKVSGFNLNKFVKKLLESMGFAVTTDCCTYFPSFPVQGVDFQTEDEVPNGGFFFGEDENLKYKSLDGSAILTVNANA